MAAQTGAPPPRLVRVLKALGDERRLRILHRLGEGEFTLQELSTHFDTGNTTMLHHLVILRAAGLVEVRGTAKRYRMRREPLDDLPRFIDLYLPSQRH